MPVKIDDLLKMSEQYLQVLKLSTTNYINNSGRNHIKHNPECKLCDKIKKSKLI